MHRRALGPVRVADRLDQRAEEPRSVQPGRDANRIGRRCVVARRVRSGRGICGRNTASACGRYLLASSCARLSPLSPHTRLLAGGPTGGVPPAESHRHARLQPGAGPSPAPHPEARGASPDTASPARVHRSLARSRTVPAVSALRRRWSREPPPLAARLGGRPGGRGHPAIAQAFAVPGAEEAWGGGALLLRRGRLPPDPSHAAIPLPSLRVPAGPPRLVLRRRARVAASTAEPAVGETLASRRISRVRFLQSGCSKDFHLKTSDEWSGAIGGGNHPICKLTAPLRQGPVRVADRLTHRAEERRSVQPDRDANRIGRPCVDARGSGPRRGPAGSLSGRAATRCSPVATRTGSGAHGSSRAGSGPRRGPADASS